MTTKEAILNLLNSNELSKDELSVITPYEVEKIDSLDVEKQNGIKEDVREFLRFKNMDTSKINVFEIFQKLHISNTSDLLYKAMITENPIGSTIEEEHRVIDERVRLRKEFIQLLKMYSV